jgi:hypothetical protein
MPAETAIHLPKSPAVAVPDVSDLTMLSVPIGWEPIVAPISTVVTAPVSEMLPELVTVPESVRPLVEPVPPTEVTVPVFEVKPDGLLAA